MGDGPQQTREDLSLVLNEVTEMFKKHEIPDPEKTTIQCLKMVSNQLEERLRGEDHGFHQSTGELRAVSAKWFVEELMVMLWPLCCKYPFSSVDDLTIPYRNSLLFILLTPSQAKYAASRMPRHLPCWSA